MIDKRGAVTNGDVIMAMFPDKDYFKTDVFTQTTIDGYTCFRKNWWDSPYKDGDNE